MDYLNQYCLCMSHVPCGVGKNYPVVLISFCNLVHWVYWVLLESRIPLKPTLISLIFTKELMFFKWVCSLLFFRKYFQIILRNFILFDSSIIFGAILPLFW